MTSVKKIADAVYNDIVSGLRGYHTNYSISIELLELDVCDLRLLVLKEYMLKGILPILDLLTSLNCIPVDCDDLTKCKCNSSTCGTPTAHFQIPQLLFDFGLKKAIYYIGSVDKQHSFYVYTKPMERLNTILKYRRRGKSKPWVYIDVTPNSQGLLDCYIFGAPLIKLVSVVGIFKDLRLLEDYQCDCEDSGEENLADSNFTFIDSIIKDRLAKLKIYYYRQLAAPLLPNDQRYTSG